MTPLLTGHLDRLLGADVRSGMRMVLFEIAYPFEQLLDRGDVPLAASARAHLAGVQFPRHRPQAGVFLALEFPDQRRQGSRMGIGIAGGPVELRDDQLGAGEVREVQRLGQFRPVVPAPALHLGKPGGYFRATGIGEGVDGGALGRQPQARLALSGGRYPLAGDETLHPYKPA